MMVGWYSFAGSYYTTYAALDWYSKDSVVTMELLNITFFHILESLVLFYCYLINRHYPTEFNIKSEILLASTLNIVFNNMLEFSSFYNTNDSCFLGLFHYNSFGDIVRLLGFILVLYIVTKKSDQYFPLPFTWIFKDLSKFIFEPTCIKVYRHYLIAKEPEGLLGFIIRSSPFGEDHQYLRESQQRQSQSRRSRLRAGNLLAP